MSSSEAALLFALEDLPQIEAPPTERHSPTGAVPSILKWTGSKRSQAARIAALAPSHKRYHEPFLGGGAVLYMLGRPGSRASDLYNPLIEFWRLVQQRPSDLIANYRTQWSLLQEDLPGYFYVVRERFNKDNRPEDLNFLMRTCVNGIVRFSKSGDFNNSFHLSRKGMKPERFENIVWSWSRKLSGVEFLCASFDDALLGVEAGDFVYLDPPYAGNKQRYIADLCPERLWESLERLNQIGARWALSFDGARGDTHYASDVPAELFKKKISLISGYSAVSKVLNGPLEDVSEALYLNY